jgi:CBS-domain-containing membrane protein
VIVMKATTVKGIMTTDVVAVREDAGFKEMVAALRSHRISAFPVVDTANRVIGLVSEADLLIKVASPALAHRWNTLTRWPTERSKAVGVTAADVMSHPAVTIDEDVSVGEAAALMQSRQVKRLPVVDGNGRLRGIISRADVLSVFERPDHEIRDEVIKDVISGRFELDPELFVATVQSGVVTVTGSVARRADALELLRAIRHLEGVVALRDRLSYPSA